MVNAQAKMFGEAGCRAKHAAPQNIVGPLLHTSQSLLLRTYGERDLYPTPPSTSSEGIWTLQTKPQHLLRRPRVRIQILQAIFGAQALELRQRMAVN